MTHVLPNIFCIEIPEDATSIKTLGLYQPFATAMLHKKVETRWVRKGRKPPFKIGRYLLYSTKKKCSNSDLFNWCGPELMSNLLTTVKHDAASILNGYALCTGDLVKIELLTPDHYPTFIKFIGEKTELTRGKEITKVQWAMIFENVTRIDPFEWTFGKQGVGNVPKSELIKIQPPTT